MDHDWSCDLNDGHHVRTSKIDQKFPEALITILLVSVLVIFRNLELAKGSFIRDGGGEGLKVGLPQLQWAIFEKIPFNFKTLGFIGPYAIILAAIGLIEFLMTLNLIDELAENPEAFEKGLSEYSL